MIFFFVCVYSKFLHELTRDGASPGESVIRRWISAITLQLGVTLRYTDHLSTILIRRANHLRWKVKSFKGSVKKQQFLQQTWKLELNEQDIELKAMENKIEYLEDEMSELHHEVDHAAQDIQQLLTENSKLRNREEQQIMAMNDLKKDKKRLQDRVRELSSSAACDHSLKTRGKSIK